MNQSADESAGAQQQVTDAVDETSDSLNETSDSATEAASTIDEASNTITEALGTVREAASEAAGAVEGIGGAGEDVAVALADMGGTVQAAMSGVADAVNTELASIERTIEISVKYVSEGLPDHAGADTGSEVQAHGGTGGIRDWGTSGTPVRLHGKEGVFTMGQIKDLMASAAAGGGGT